MHLSFLYTLTKIHKFFRQISNKLKIDKTVGQIEKSISKIDERMIKRDKIHKFKFKVENSKYTKKYQSSEKFKIDNKNSK